MTIDFDKVRPLFGGRLSQSQVDGISAIVSAFGVDGDDDPRHLAYLLATAKLSLQKLPPLAAGDKTNHASGYSELYRHEPLVAASVTGRSDSFYSLFCEFCGMVFAVRVAALVDHIMNVVRLSANEQVGWINARRVIA